MQEALLLQQLMGLAELLLRLLLRMPVPLGLGTAGHPVDLVLPVRQTSEDLLMGDGEVVLVTHLPPSLEMLLIPEITESKIVNVRG